MGFSSSTLIFDLSIFYSNVNSKICIWYKILSLNYYNINYEILVYPASHTSILMHILSFLLIGSNFMGPLCPLPTNLNVFTSGTYYFSLGTRLPFEVRDYYQSSAVLTVHAISSIPIVCIAITITN